MKLMLRSLVSLALLSTISAAQAQDLNPFEHYGDRIDSAKQITMVGADAFGDQISLQNGALSFEVTDVDLPGNSGLPVRFARRFEVQNARAEVRGYPIGDWSIETPRISGRFSEGGWLAGSSIARCTDYAPPNIPDVPGNIDPFFLSDFWHGINLHIPGVVSSELLVPAAGLPLPNANHKWTTQDGQTRVTCLSMIANGTGEGFEVLTPDGMRYQFDWMVARPQVGRWKIGVDSAGVDHGISLPITEYSLHATLVRDRFNNWVRYSYDPIFPQRLTKIEGANADGSDPRVIDLTYAPSTGLLEKVTANGREWRYWYGIDDSPAQKPSLNKVTLPDSKEWLINFSDLSFTPIHPQTGAITRTCYVEELPQNFPDRPTGIITHPSGAVATFTVSMQEHFRSNVTLSCENVVIIGGQNDESDDYPFYALSSYSWTLDSKQIAHPGLTPKLWTYNFVSTDAGWGSFHLYPGTNINAPVCTYSQPGASPPFRCPFPAITTDTSAGYSLTTVTQPDGSLQVHKFGTSWQYNEGKLLSIERKSAAGTSLEIEESTFDLSRMPGTSGQAAQNYAARFGTSRRDRADGFDAEYHRPQIGRTIARDSATFTWATAKVGTTLQTDTWARALQLTHSSSLGFSRAEHVGFSDSTAPWVIGQRSSTIIDGMETQTITFHPTTALPNQIRSYGALKETRGYHADGTLWTSIDGNSFQTQFLAWQRGVPTEIRYHDDSRIKATVDANGWIKSTTSEGNNSGNNHVTQYGHDLMGRINSITPPANPGGDPWATTSIEFIKNPDAAYGLAANEHWRKRLTNGQYRQDTYFDAFWRPVVTREYAIGGGIPERLRVTRYDTLDREVFSSYPRDTLSSYTDTMNGITKVHDALGRIATETASSELGPLLTSYQWKPGFILEVTDPRLKLTKTHFKAWSEPVTDFPMKVEAPEGQTTEWERDSFGKPMRMWRTTMIDNQSVTRERKYGYDAQHRLCQRWEPETGLHVYAYDNGDNIDWSAHGLNAGFPTFGQIFANGFEEPLLPGPGQADCGRGTIAESERIKRLYDVRNRLLAIDYPEPTAQNPVPTADIAYTYYDDSSVKTATRNNGSVWTYQYNSLGQLTSESFAYKLQPTRTFLHGYDTRGNRKDLTWPDNTLTDYAPNVFGEPSRVGTYTQGVSYHADGSLAGATLGTSITLARTPNMRFLPSQLHYAAGASLVNLSYIYDKNANVEQITDLRAGTDNQTFGYDGLNRLTSANGPNRYGSASYTYDVFDDLRQANIGTRSWTYRYEDNTGRLTRISNAGNGTEWSFQYDARGNTDIAAGPTSTLDLVYDRADTLSQIVGQESYLYDAHGHRVEAIVAGQVRYPIHTRDGLLRIEYGPTTERYFHLGTQLVAKESAGVAKYLLTDHLGSPIAVSDANGNVQPQDRSFFAPFGERWGAPAVRGKGYTEHFEDATGLNYMKARYQHPVIGRMWSPDQVMPDSGTGDNFSRYAYANNNPIKYLDPDGREVQVAGSKQDVTTFKNQLYRATGIKVANRNGKLGQVGARNASVGSKVAAKVLQSALKSSDVISVKAVRNSSDVIVDTFETNEVDVADVEAWFSKSDTMGAAIVTHIVSERAFGAANGAGWDEAHPYGVKMESEVMGYSSRTETFDNGTIELQYRDANGNIGEEYSFKLNENKDLE